MKTKYKEKEHHIIECDACHEKAIRKDFRSNGKYLVCYVHFNMADLPFYKAVKNKTT